MAAAAAAATFITAAVAAAATSITAAEAAAAVAVVAAAVVAVAALESRVALSTQERGRAGLAPFPYPFVLCISTLSNCRLAPVAIRRRRAERSVNAAETLRLVLVRPTNLPFARQTSPRRSKRTPGAA